MEQILPTKRYFMIAEVYPIKRLPRRFRVFDYIIPDGLDVKRGNFVLVPWRSRQIWGVVAKVKQVQPRSLKLKEIIEVMETVVLVEQEVGFYEQVAFDLVQSVGSILHAAWPKIPKRIKQHPRQPRITYQLTLPKSELKNVQKILEQTQSLKQGFILSSDLRRAAACIAGLMKTKPGQANLVICPNVRDAELLAAALEHWQPILVSGQETPIARWQAWQAWREQGGLFIGTRLSALLLHPKIENVFLVRAAHQNHKQEDRNPRYDTRILAQRIKETWSAKLWFLDALPRVDDLAFFRDNEFLGCTNPTSLYIVEKQKEKNTSPHPALGSTTISLIEETLLRGEKVICVYNRKGMSRQLKCSGCGYTFPCANCQGRHLVYEHTIKCHHCGRVEPTPLQCPRCGGTDLWHQGFGNRLIARALQKLFPQNTVGLIEKDDSLGASANADILVVTNFWLENIFNPFERVRAGLVIDLDADMGLYEPSFRSLERTFLHLEEWRGVARALDARFLIQTDSADLYRQYLANSKQTLINELAMRQAYAKPPARRFVRITAKDMGQREAEVGLNQAKQAVLVQDPQATALGLKLGQNLEIGFNPDKSKQILKELAKLDDSYIIDSNVNI